MWGKCVRWGISAGLLVALAGAAGAQTALNSGNASPTNSWGVTANASSWNLIPSTTVTTGTTPVPGEVICPGQDISGGTCTSNNYLFLYQIPNGANNSTITFNNLPNFTFTPGATVGIMQCNAGNTVPLCNNLSAGALDGLGLTASGGPGSLTVRVPTFPGGACATASSCLVLFVRESGVTGFTAAKIPGANIAQPPIPTNPTLVYLPHVPYGGGYRTKITLVNFSLGSASGVVNFISQGGQLVTTQNWGPVASGGTVRIDTATVFPNSTFGPLQVLWAVVGAPDRVGVNLFYEYNPSSGGPAYNIINSVGFNDAALQTDFTVPFEQEPQPQGAAAGKTVGMAISNPGSSTASVTVKLVDNSGTILGTDTVLVAAYGQVAFALPDASRLPNITAHLPAGNFVGTLAISSLSGVAVIALQQDYGPFSATPTMPYRVR